MNRLILILVTVLTSVVIGATVTAASSGGGLAGIHGPGTADATNAPPPTRELATGQVMPANTGTAASKVPPEQRLAAIQTNGFIPEGSSMPKVSDPLVASIKQQIDTLAARCAEDPSRLADLTLEAQNRLSKRHIKANPQAILSGVSSAVPAKDKRQSCRTAFADYDK